jgi:hypothetical protein
MPALPIENIGASFVSGEKEESHDKQYMPEMIGLFPGDETSFRRPGSSLHDLVAADVPH